MTYCPSCGAEIGDHLEYCPSCGAQINAEDKNKIPKPGHDEIQMAKSGHAQFQQELPQLVQRNYLIWFLLSYLTGVVMFIYMYFVFDDLNKLDKYPKPAGVKSTYLDQNTVILYIVLYFLGFGIIANYLVNSKKYGMFNDYLDTHPQKQNKLPSKKYIKLMIVRDILGFLMSGVGMVFYFIFLIGFDMLNIGSGIPTFSNAMLIMSIIAIVLTGICFVAVMIIAIYLIVLDFRWQEAMNERVRIIDPNFIKKDFL